MRLAADYIHTTPNSGHCRVRIYEPTEERDAPVVVCTELEENPGMSINNAAEGIAAEVISSNSLPIPVVWIEHYEHGARGTLQDPQTFELVIFSSYEVEDLGSYLGEHRKRIGSPRWKPLDRAAVESLVGGAV